MTRTMSFAVVLGLLLAVLPAVTSYYEIGNCTLSCQPPQILLRLSCRCLNPISESGDVHHEKHDDPDDGGEQIDDSKSLKIGQTAPNPDKRETTPDNTRETSTEADSSPGEYTTY